MLEVKEVLRLYLRGRGKRAIARSIGVSRNTVRSYLETAAECGLTAESGEAALTEEKLGAILVRLKTRPRRAKGDSWAQCEAEREFVGVKLKGSVRLSKVRRLLERRGVAIPYATLHRFAVHELGFGRASLTIPVADCGPGEEIQVDTGWMGLLEPDSRGCRRRFRAWIFTAARSRHRFVYPCLRETTATAIEACEAAWEFFGGVFRVLIPDNTKAIVQRYDPLAPLINATFRAYAQSRGFEIDPTRRRSPKDKGRVERAVRTTRDDCFAGEQLQDIEAAQRRARHWCQQEYGMRRHTRTQRLPLEQFEAEERPALLPAPRERYDVPHCSDPTIGRDQYGQVLMALYSVPAEFEGVRLIGRRLRAHADRSLVRLYLGVHLVKTHPRQPPGGRSTDPLDFTAAKFACANRDIAFHREQAALHGEAVGRFANALLDGRLPWTRMRQVYALLGLCKRYGSGRVEQTCGLALAADMVDVQRLARMLEQGRPERERTHLAAVVPLARYLRPIELYAVPSLTPPHEETTPS